MVCYTFGAPRVGNQAWASECGDLVPATFHVINDQVPCAAAAAAVYDQAGRMAAGLKQLHGQDGQMPLQAEAPC